MAGRPPRPAGAPSRLHNLAKPLFALALLIAPNTERADCGNLEDRYRAAVAEVLGALRSYESCLAASVKHGARHDDCADEMQTLDSAHDNLADAVADEKTCH